MVDIITINVCQGFVEHDGADPGAIHAELPSEYAVDWSNEITVDSGLRRAPIIMRWKIAVSDVSPSGCCDTEGAIDAVVEIVDQRTGKDYDGGVTLVPDPGRPSVARKQPLGIWGSRANWASSEIIRALDDVGDGTGIELAGLIEHAVNHAMRCARASIALSSSNRGEDDDVEV